MTILQGLCVVKEAPETLKFLVDWRADLEARFTLGLNAVICAAAAHQTRNLEALIDCGAVADAIDGLGATTMAVMAMHSCPETLRMLDKKCPELFKDLGETRGAGIGHVNWTI